MRQILRRALHHIHLPFRRKAKEKSTLDSNEPPVDASHGSHEPSNNYKSEPRHSIWGRQLRQGQIRLFKMELDWNDDIRGTLEVFEHKTAPEYFAQSYVCGEGGCHSKIVVNGSAHYIKANLYVALLKLRERCENLAKRQVLLHEPHGCGGSGSMLSVLTRRMSRSSQCRSGSWNTSTGTPK
jgi:hypothetical protein